MVEIAWCNCDGCGKLTRVHEGESGCPYCGAINKAQRPSEQK
jgi:hypothetical protein